MKDELDKINQSYNEALLEIETNEREQSVHCFKSSLEETFSDQMVNMHENQRELDVRATRLEQELNATQTEYNSLKTRYDDITKKLDSVQMENQRLNKLLNEQQQAALIRSPPSEWIQMSQMNNAVNRDADISSIASNDVEIDSEKYVSIDFNEGNDLHLKENDEDNGEYTLSEQLKILRENLNEAKNDVDSLREEKLKFEMLSENLNEELNTLKSQLQNQSVFNMSRTDIPPEESITTLRFLEASIHELMSASGYNLYIDTNESLEECALPGNASIERDSKLEESMLPSHYLHGNGDQDDDSASENEVDSLQENTLFHDSILAAEETVDGKGADLVGDATVEDSILARVDRIEESSIFLQATPERSNAEAKRLFQKIKYIVETTRDEQNIIYKQLNFLKNKFSALSLVDDADEAVDYLDTPSSSKVVALDWKELEEGLLNQQPEVLLIPCSPCIKQ